MSAGLQMADWAYDVYRNPSRWQIAEGGRGSGKSVGLHQAFLLRGMDRRQRMLCTRETQQSLEDSSHALLRELCEENPATFGAFYDVKRTRIVGANGTEIIFRGLSESHGTTRAIRSLQNIRLALIEEAQFISAASFEILVPTIRAAGSEIWAALNPLRPDDPVYMQGRSGAADVKHYVINWRENKWWNEVQEGERIRFQQMFPERYEHVYEGQLDTEGAGLKLILSYKLLEDCQNAFQPEFAGHGRPEIGFDVADEGQDRCCVVASLGPVLIDYDRWSGRGKSLAYSTARALDFVRKHNGFRMNYDEGGLGAGVKSELAKLTAKSAKLPFEVRGYHFNGKVAGKKRQYTKGRTNADEFADRGAQLGWNLHIRAQRTRMLREGRSIDPQTCLFIGDAVRRVRDVKADASQPTWDYTATGRKRIVKAEKNQASPDIYDAWVLSRASDSDRGLTMGGKRPGFADLYM